MSCPRPPCHSSVPGDTVADRHRLNTLAPISHIPSDILITIFFYIRGDEMPEYIEPYQHTPPNIVIPKRTTALGWIVVTHVCSYWRHVAIQACLLWSYVPLTWNSDWMWTILTRSQSVPLSILQPTDEGLTSDAIRTIQEHASRIQWLHISTDPMTMETLFSKLCGRMPLLKTVTFAACDEYGWPMVSRIPPALFDGDTLAVSRLSLINCVVPWDSSNFCNSVRNLTSLHITLPFDDLLWSTADFDISRSEIVPSLTQLLDLLRLTPRLEHLTLDHILPEYTAEDYPHRDRDEAVFLRNLKVCHLFGNALDCAAVARHIYPSHDAFLDLEVTFEDDEQMEAEYAAIAAVLEHHVSFRTQSTPTLSKTEINMDLSTSHLSIHSSVYHVSIYTIWNSHCDAFIRRCVASLHPPAPTTLLFRSRGGAEPDPIHIFDTNSLLGVTEVVLTHDDEDGFNNFFDALCKDCSPQVVSPDGVTQQGPIYIFPELRTLSLKTISFDEVGHGWVSSLWSAVAMRKKFGMKLELHDCLGVDRALLKQLHSIPGLQIVYDEETRKHNHLEP